MYFQTFDVAETIERGAKKFVGCFTWKWMVQLRSKMLHDAAWVHDAPPQLIALLSIDGKPAAWTAKRAGAQLGPDFYDSLYNGESYDARPKRSALQLPGFADTTSASPAIAASSAANAATLTSQQFAPFDAWRLPAPSHLLRTMSKFLILVKIWQVVELRNLRCRGNNITIRHAELLTHPPYDLSTVFTSAI